MPAVRLRRLMVSFCLFLIICTIFFTGCTTGPEKEVVADVNGEEIFKQDLNEYLNLIYLYWPDYQTVFSEAEKEEALKQEILWFLIENRILDQEARKIGLEINEEEIEKNVRDGRDELINNVYITEDEFSSRMQELGLSEASLGIIFRDAQLRNVLLQHVGSEVTEEDARTFVEENPAFLEQSPYAHAFHILVETEEEAQEIIQLLEEGADFMELGQERSLDSYVELGPIRPEDSLDPIFLEAAFALEPGEISSPVQTSFGFHIIKITEKEEARTLTFEEVREEAMEMQKQIIFEKYFEQLMKDTPVETF